MDVINRLLLTSDPLISCQRSKVHRKREKFSKEALELLLPMETENVTEAVACRSTEDEESE